MRQMNGSAGGLVGWLHACARQVEWRSESLVWGIAWAPGRSLAAMAQLWANTAFVWLRRLHTQAPPPLALLRSGKEPSDMACSTASFRRASFYASWRVAVLC